MRGSHQPCSRDSTPETTGSPHLEDLDLDGANVPNWKELHEGTGILFRSTSPDAPVTWHLAPRKQYCITLSGQVEIGLGDGSKHYFGPGDVMLAEDLTGKGHTTRAVGPEPRVVAYVPVD